MTGLITAVAIDGAGQHPAAWREDEAAADNLFGPERAVKLVQQAERAGIDFVTLADSLGPASPRPGEIKARLDALSVLARVAPETDRIGLVPTVTTTHTEPFHLQAAVATLDHVSDGRAGWQIAVSDTQLEASHFGRRAVAEPAALWTEAGEVADVSRRLWDSWEDDAEIRDVTSGRFIDRERLHYPDFAGSHFAVRGPSIVPRSPQAQPPIVITLTGPQLLPVAAGCADVVLIPESDRSAISDAVAALRRAATDAGRDPDQIRVLATLSVLLANDIDGARRRAARLDSRTDGITRIDHVGTVAALVEFSSWLPVIGVDGIHLRPAAIPADTDLIAAELLPALRTAALVAAPDAGPVTLRHRLGLPRPKNRYATAPVSTTTQGVSA